MATEEDVAAGLLNWVNSLQVTNPLYTVDDLATGEALWELLQLIDHLAFPGRLPEDPSRIDSSKETSWVQKWSNLKHIYDALSIFLIEQCGQPLPLFFSSATNHRGNPDLKAIAQYGSIGDAVLLLKLCVVAATSCQDNERFLEPMQDLPESVQKVLIHTIQEGQQNDEPDYTEQEHDAHISDAEEDYFNQHRQSLPQAEEDEDQGNIPTGTSNLAFEERLGKVIADSQRISREKHELQRHIDALNARYNSLQERYDRSQDDLNEANDRLTSVLSGRAGDTKQSSDAQKEAIISSLEAQLAQYETDIENLRKNNEVLKIKAERGQKLQDDYDEIKIERDNLSRKANAAEKYRQKLEASQDHEKENLTLKQKIADLQAQLRQSDTRTASSSDLQREIDEYRRLLPAIEQERHEVNEMKKRLELDYHLLQARHTESEEQLRRSKQEVEDLQGRLRDYDDGVEPASANSPNSEEIEVEGKDLETEEADYERAEARLQAALVASEVDEGTGVNGETTSTIPVHATTSNLEGIDIDLVENGISEDELRAIMSAMRAQMVAGTSSERETSLKMQKKMVIMLEKARSKNQTLVEHIKHQHAQLEELKQRPEKSNQEQELQVKEPSTESEMEQQLEEQDVLIENLKREIRLISSAWFEQNQRLATLGSGTGGGAVALMRLKGGNGLEEPKSFLGRQRKMLDKAAFGMNQNIRVTRG
ncbi:hypothetical protein LTS08_000456 [Lithohypha guttulata]|uniref:HOOK N-terminal domain-containing protein n=1 Tax=Lithohypha guttulata TaxID=1690604 RepID=A0AAN7T470_9EURO|nr:hypothetical protein LTR51_006821 [Lithohypha guttulata]KAK5089136.1 hypothetical protein LTR05_003360 [Lithohypha guttulata]KAK5106338.1 hypothetical protein LTS08_000456 [Lithohypha guttulata]